MKSTPVFLLEKSHGQRSMEGYSPWDIRVGHTHTHTHTQHLIAFKGHESWPRLHPSLSVGGSERSQSYNLKRKRNKGLGRWCWSKQKTLSDKNGLNYNPAPYSMSLLVIYLIYSSAYVFITMKAISLSGQDKVEGRKNILFKCID